VDINSASVCESRVYAFSTPNPMTVSYGTNTSYVIQDIIINTAFAAAYYVPASTSKRPLSASAIAGIAISAAALVLDNTGYVGLAVQVSLQRYKLYFGNPEISPIRYIYSCTSFTSATPKSAL